MREGTQGRDMHRGAVSGVPPVGGGRRARLQKLSPRAKRTAGLTGAAMATPPWGGAPAGGPSAFEVISPPAGSGGTCITCNPPDIRSPLFPRYTGIEPYGWYPTTANTAVGRPARGFCWARHPGLSPLWFHKGRGLSGCSGCLPRAFCGPESTPYVSAKGGGRPARLSLSFCRFEESVGGAAPPRSDSVFFVSPS